MSKKSASDGMGENVLFHEMYNIYYRIVARLIESAEKSPLTAGKIRKFVKEAGFGETEVEFINKFYDGSIPVFYENAGGTYSTTLKSVSRPLSLAEKRWLASIAADERLGLFLNDAEIEKLKASLGSPSNVEPLYKKECFSIVDGVNDPDPFSDALYKKNFRTLLDALRQKKLLKIHYRPRDGRESEYTAEPAALQYSDKDGKFRLLCAVRYADGDTTRNVILNVSRIINAEILHESSAVGGSAAEPEMKTAVIRLSRELGTPERAMIQFSNYECSSRLDGKGEILMNVKYSADDEMELLIRVLSFGALVQVLEPDSLVSMIKERLKRQVALTLNSNVNRFFNTNKKLRTAVLI